MPPFRGDIKVPKSVGAEQPFVADRNHEVWLYPLDIEVAGAKRLTCVNYQRSANPSGPLSDSLQVELASVRPVTLRHSHDGRFFIDCLLHCLGPVLSSRALHRYHSRAGLPCRFMPSVDIRGELLMEEDDGPA